MTKETAGWENKKLWPREGFFPVYQYFNSRLHDSDSAKSRKGWCELQGNISTESQIPGLGREKEESFSLQLKLCTKEVRNPLYLWQDFSVLCTLAGGQECSETTAACFLLMPSAGWTARVRLRQAETAHRHKSNHKAPLSNTYQVLCKPLRKTEYLLRWNKNAQNYFTGLKLGKGQKLIFS